MRKHERTCFPDPLHHTQLRAVTMHPFIYFLFHVAILAWRITGMSLGIMFLTMGNMNSNPWTRIAVFLVVGGPRR